MNPVSRHLPQLRIGPTEIDFPVVQAALSGYSDWPTRVIARRLGAPYTVGEAMLDRFVVNVSRGRKAGRYIRVTDEEHPCGAQLMGSAGEELAPAAITLAAAGFDVIDLNFACPVKKVLLRRRGGYLLSQPKTALEIVGRVRDALPPNVPLTVKMRRGMDDSQQSRESFFAIFDGVFQLGVAAVTVHGRTVQQRYQGPSSWEFLREVKQHAGHRTVLGSGDLFTAEACLAMMAETGVDGVTAARGAIGNPWIFSQARALAAGRAVPPPSLSEQRAVLTDHYRLAEETYGPRRCPRVMRKFGIKYSRLHPQAVQVRDTFAAVRSPGQWREVLATWYTGEARGCVAPAGPQAEG
jgi:tRNA-dihydrouridine synthase B